MKKLFVSILCSTIKTKTGILVKVTVAWALKTLTRFFLLRKPSKDYSRFASTCLSGSQAFGKLALLLLFFSASAVSQNNFSDWKYYREVALNNTNNTGTLTNYSVLIIVNTQTLIAQGKMNSNGSDIRFTTDFSTELDYWIEPGIQNEFGMNDDSTHIWVKVPNIIGSSNTTIYMVYGNSSAISKSDIGTTFLFGDDFDDNSFNTLKWGTQIEAQGQVNEQNQRLEHNSPATSPQSQSIVYSKQNFTGPVVLEMRFKKGGYVYRGVGLTGLTGISDNNRAWFGWQDWGQMGVSVNLNGISTGYDFRTDTWSREYNPEYYLKVIRDKDSTFSFFETIPAFEENGYKHYEYKMSDVKMPLDTPLMIGTYEMVWTNAWWLWTRYEDDIRVRKYSSPEPSTLVGVESGMNVQPPIPAAPQNLTATAGNGQVTLTWKKNTEADFLKYRVYMGTDSVSMALKDSTVGGVADTARTITGLTNSTKYYFRVSALNSARLESGQSYAIIGIPNASIVPAGLMAWYPFNGTPNDSSGNGNNGTNNGATLTADRFENINKAYNFDGSSDFITITNYSFLNSANDFSYSVFFKPTSNISGSGNTLSCNDCDEDMLIFSLNNGPYLGINKPTGKLYCIYLSTSGNIIIQSQTYLWQKDTWYHITVTNDRNTIKLFINGILENQLSTNPKASSGDGFGLVIGKSHWRSLCYLQGSIDDIRIYNRALSEMEIDSLYYEGGWKSTTTNWCIQLQANAASVVDNENYLGVSNAATDTLDQLFDIPKPPLPQGSYVQVYFPHPEWGSALGNNFAKDIKKNISLADTIKRWYFQVKSNVVNDTVALTFINDRIPSAFGKYLTDLKSRKRINLKNTSVYKYFNTSDTARSFMIIIGDSIAPQLTLTSPNGSNIWRSGTNKNIAWLTSDGTGIDSVFVYSSSNGGSSYSPVRSLGPVQSTNWTIPGEYLNNNYSIKIISRDSLGNQSTIRSAKTFTIVGDSLARSNSAGWSLISSPLIPNESSITNIFGTTSYLWTYTQATGYTQPSTITLGNGYWLGVTATKNWFIKGITNEADSSVQNLQLGYNLIGNNFVRNVSKNNLYFLKSSSYYGFNSAVSVGLISNTLYGYSLLGYSSIDTMSLFGGYWIGVIQSGVQLIQKPNVSIITPLAKQMKTFAMNWDLPISISTTSLSDNIAAIGIKPTATADFDPQYDSPRPPRNPGSKYLEIYFTHTGGNYPAILGSKYAKDYRGSDNPIWVFTIESSDQETITLQWDPNVFKQLGSSIKLVLTDQGTSTSIDMTAQASYSFNYSSLRSFTIASTITGVDDNSPNKPTSHALKQNYPNPFNPSTQIEFSIPQSSHVTLKVYDVLGKEVSTLVNGEREIGTYTATWNAQNCPSGVYFYRLTAGSYTLTKKLLLIR